MTEDLLPYNSTQAERSLSLATARIGSVPVDFQKNINPDTCSAEMLPWLAWAFHVDTWDSAWTETQKRNVIRSSFEVHRLKGTVGAVRRMASSFGAGIVVQEWFQQAPAGDPYTFNVFLSVPGISAGQAASIISAIASVKPVRSQINATLIEPASLIIAANAYIRTGTFRRVETYLN